MSKRKMTEVETKSLLLNEVAQSVSSDQDDGSDISNLRYTVEDAIEAIGFGRFQIKLVCMVGFSWSADSLEMALIAILAPAIRCYWSLTHWHEAFLTTMVFIGMFISTTFWGYLSDNKGRRLVLILASLGIFVFGLISAFSVSYLMIAIMRCLVGASMSGTVQGTTLLAEYLPIKTRGFMINASGIFWALGTSVEILIAWLVMPNHGWRWLLFISAWPSILFVATSFLTGLPPESARFLTSKGKTQEARDILEKAANENKKDLPRGNLCASEQVKNVKHGSITEMFRFGYWKLTVLLWIIWFSSHFNVYGIALLATALYSSDMSCYGSSDIPTDTNCKPLSSSDYIDFFYVLAADFPAMVVTAILADTVGRKWLQAIGFLLSAGFFACLFICTGSRSWTTLFLFMIRCFASVVDIGGYIYTSEVYPTHIRGLALGMCSGIARVGCMITPFVAQVLSHYSLSLAISVYVGFSLLGALCSLLLPVETMGKGLEQIDLDITQQSRSRDQLSREHQLSRELPAFE